MLICLKIRTFAIPTIMQRKANIINKFTAVLLMTLVSAVTMTAFPPIPEHGRMFNTLILRLHNGAVIRTGAVSHLQLLSDKSLRIGPGEKAIEVPLNQVKGWSYERTDSITVGVEEIGTTSERIQFRLSPTGISVQGLRSGDILTLSDIQGKSSVLPYDGDSYCLPLASLPEGIYIINVAGCSFKFAVR